MIELANLSPWLAAYWVAEMTGSGVSRPRAIGIVCEMDRARPAHRERIRMGFALSLPAVDMIDQRTLAGNGSVEPYAERRARQAGRKLDKNSSQRGRRAAKNAAAMAA